VVRQREIPSDIETVPLPDDLRANGTISIDKLLARIGLAESVSEAARKRKAGAVTIDGVKQLEPKFAYYAGSIYTIQVGKKWRRVAV
jgi:tyrosyl-tRNA synthetase